MLNGKPLVIECFAGCMTWSAGWLALGGYAVGFDVEHLPHHGPVPKGADLVLQDVLTLDGAQFKDADLLLMSPPCQAYSYMAMPWSRGKHIAGGLLGECPFPEGYEGARTVAELNALFDACFRIQREACAAAGRYIPMVVENVKGAQRWVGPAKALFGSYYLWGDVGMVGNRVVAGPMRFGDSVRALNSRKLPAHISESIRQGKFPARWTNPDEHYFGRKSRIPATGNRFDERVATTPEEAHALHYRMPVNGTKQGGDWFNQSQTGSISRRYSSRYHARKAASAQIAKIPPALSHYIAKAYWPKVCNNGY